MLYYPKIAGQLQRVTYTSGTTLRSESFPRQQATARDSMLQNMTHQTALVGGLITCQIEFSLLLVNNGVP